MPDRPDTAYAPATARSLPIALLRAREAVMAPVRDMLAEIGLTEQQWRVLRVLEEAGPCGMTELAARASLLMPSLTRIVRDLQARGLAERRGDKGDRRRQTVAASDDGLALVRANLSEAARIATLLQNALGPDRHEMLLTLLNDLQGMDLRRQA